MANFKLRTTIPGHEKDVRCICKNPKTEGVISGSRDVTVRSWIPQGREFSQQFLLDGHNNFISSVEIAIPYHGTEAGVIFTGSNDTTIRAHDAADGKFLFTLRAHNETVCSLRYCESARLLVSGSWDKTAKLWQDDQCISTLGGHEAAVWAAVFLPKGDGVITGSADKTIRLWRPLSFSQAKWTCQQRFIGHSDCVRGLVVLSDEEFLSCSNDASMRLWKINGECIREFYGHTNFIYGIALLPSGDEFVSCSEDRSVRVWNVRTGETVQSLTMSCQSVWCVTALNNGDFAVGGNDAMIRVFSRHPELEAPPEELNVFNEQVSSVAIPGQVGDIKLNEVPGPEVLSRPGKSEGFVTMVRRGATVECYQWSQGQWSKIGDVVGSSGATQQNSGKQLFEGREYDYVFTVDVIEGAPPLKLPYNISEDPFVAAQAFIHRHNLPQAYLEQIADFITKQSAGVTLQQSTDTAASYADPFTGGGRYIPGSGREVGAGASSDPFTGGGRYVPGSGANTPVADPPVLVTSTYFPMRQLLTFDAVNVDALIKKLREFNDEQCHQLTEEQLKGIPRLLEKDGPSDPQMFDVVVETVQKWTLAKRFPLLDVIRLAIRNARINECAFKNQTFLSTFLELAAEMNCSPVNQMLIYRIIANAYTQPPGQKLILNAASEVLEHLKAKVSEVAKSQLNNLQVAYSTIVLNMVVLLGHSPDADLLLSEFLLILGGQLLSYDTLSPEAQFRLLVSMGTLVKDLKGADRTTLVLASDLPSVVSKYCDAPEKVGAVARDLRHQLSRSDT